MSVGRENEQINEYISMKDNVCLYITQNTAKNLDKKTAATSIYIRDAKDDDCKAL